MTEPPGRRDLYRYTHDWGDGSPIIEVRTALTMLAEELDSEGRLKMANQVAWAARFIDDFDRVKNDEKDQEAST
jgi:hypothetical protein